MFFPTDSQVHTSEHKEIFQKAQRAVFQEYTEEEILKNTLDTQQKKLDDLLFISEIPNTAPLTAYSASQKTIFENIAGIFRSHVKQEQLIEEIEIVQNNITEAENRINMCTEYMNSKTPERQNIAQSYNLIDVQQELDTWIKEVGSDVLKMYGLENSPSPFSELEKFLDQELERIQAPSQELEVIEEYEMQL